MQEKQRDVDRQLDETTRELHREREKLMAVIRMSGDLIFEYDIVNDKCTMPVRKKAFCIPDRSRKGTLISCSGSGQPDGNSRTTAGRSVAQWQTGYLYRTLQDR